MGLQIELQTAADSLKEHQTEGISVASGCELFMRFVTRTALENAEYEECKKRILSRGEFFRDHSTRARAKIAELGSPFLRDGHIVLTTGFSRVVLNLLLHAAMHMKRLFEVVVADSQPGGPGLQLAQRLVEAGIPVTVIDESAVAVAMERADMALVGAEGVVENGGVISKIGTYQMAIVCQASRKPFYIAVESFKFVRQYPLNQRDIVAFDGLARRLSVDAAKPAASKAKGIEVEYERRTRDYTPPKYITLLFTDLGVLTPSAVSDELIKLYY